MEIKIRDIAREFAEKFYPQWLSKFDAIWRIVSERTNLEGTDLGLPTGVRNVLKFARSSTQESNNMLIGIQIFVRVSMGNEEISADNLDKRFQPILESPNISTQLQEEIGQLLKEFMLRYKKTDLEPSENVLEIGLSDNKEFFIQINSHPLQIEKEFKRVVPDIIVLALAKDRVKHKKGALCKSRDLKIYGRDYELDLARKLLFTGRAHFAPKLEDKDQIIKSVKDEDFMVQLEFFEEIKVYPSIASFVSPYKRNIEKIFEVLEENEAAIEFKGFFSTLKNFGRQSYLMSRACKTLNLRFNDNDWKALFKKGIETLTEAIERVCEKNKARIPLSNNKVKIAFLNEILHEEPKSLLNGP